MATDPPNLGPANLGPPNLGPANLGPANLGPQCEDALHEIYHLLAGELDEAKRRQIAQHLDQCSPCAEPYDFYAELRRVLAERCRDTAPPSLLARIEDAIGHEAH